MREPHEILAHAFLGIQTVEIHAQFPTEAILTGLPSNSIGWRNLAILLHNDL